MYATGKRKGSKCLGRGVHNTGGKETLGIIEERREKSTDTVDD